LQCSAEALGSQRMLVQGSPRSVRFESGMVTGRIGVEPTGSDIQVVAKMGGEDIVVLFRERHQFKPGEKIRLKPDPKLVHLFDAATKKTVRLNPAQRLRSGCQLRMAARSLLKKPRRSPVIPAGSGSKEKCSFRICLPSTHFR
jgi:hypothetical protein